MNETRTYATFADDIPVYAIKVGDQIAIDGVECIITGIDVWGITTRPVTDAD